MIYAKYIEVTTTVILNSKTKKVNESLIDRLLGALILRLRLCISSYIDERRAPQKKSVIR